MAQNDTNSKNQHIAVHYVTPNKRNPHDERERQLNKAQRPPNSFETNYHHKWQSECSSKISIPILPLKRAESGMLFSNKENYDEPDFGRSINGLNTDRITVTTVSDFQEKLWDKDRYDDSGLKTEIKYMIGRLLKVKNKLEKQGEQISLSRSPNKRSPSPMRTKGEYISVKSPFRKKTPNREKTNKGMKRVESIPSWTSNGNRSLRKERIPTQEYSGNVSGFEYRTSCGRY